jgi:hypothetical protein
MLSKFIYFILFTFSTAKLTNVDELRRQYTDYLTIFNKQESPDGLETFVKSLHRIEDFNKNNNNNCRMYLTQHSDDKDEQEFSYTHCFKKNNI